VILSYITGMSEIFTASYFSEFLWNSVYTKKKNKSTSSLLLYSQVIVPWLPLLDLQYKNWHWWFAGIWAICVGTTQRWNKKLMWCCPGAARRL